MSVVLAALASVVSTQSGNNTPKKWVGPPPVVWVQPPPPLPPRPAIHITPENVELTEAGRFDLSPVTLASIAVPSGFTNDQAFTVKVWFGAAGGKPLHCEASSPSPIALSKIVCDRVTQSARFTFYPGFVQPLSRGFVMLYVSRHVARRSKARAVPRIFAEVEPGYQGADLRYAPDTTPETARIAIEEGVLEVSVTADDYPATALRAELQGRSTVLLGISSDGRVVSCRPIGSSGAAVLDNATCALIVRRGVFRFAPTAKSYSGLRYRTRALLWNIPQ